MTSGVSMPHGPLKGKGKKGQRGAAAAVPGNTRHHSQAVKDAARQLLEDMGRNAPGSATKRGRAVDLGAVAEAVEEHREIVSGNGGSADRRSNKRKRLAAAAEADGVGQANDTVRDAAKRTNKGKEKKWKADPKGDKAGGRSAESASDPKDHHSTVPTKGKGRGRKVKGGPAAARHATPTGSSHGHGTAQPGQQSGEEASEGGAGRGKSGKRMKAMQHLLLKGEKFTPATLSNRAFDTDPTDHCETPFEAYRDVEAFLFKIAQSLNKSKAELLIYDPYYCEGSMVKHLSKLGFTSVYNRNEDFYRVIEERRVPKHDVVLTNPPFSGDHMSKIANFCVSNPRGPKPFFLLMPNFVMKKTYWKEALQVAPAGSAPPSFLVPYKAYQFWSPGRSKFCSRFVANTRGGVGAAVPFETIWYIGGMTSKAAKEMALWWGKKYANMAKCTLATSEAELPAGAVPIRVTGGEKRMNPRRRKALMKKGKV